MSIRPLLSICIPTYNRAEHLRHTLASITSQPPFLNTEEVEIIISDNNSADHTAAVAQEYINRFGSKIKYFCNEKNIGFDNFEKSMSLANGEFLKLNNDTLSICAGGLEKMLNLIKANIEERPVLFFHILREEGQVSCNNLNEFFEEVSYYNTWIASFGLWREEFFGNNFFRDYNYTQIPQSYVLLHFIANGKRAVVCEGAFLKPAMPKNKGGYNIAEVFGKNYLIILKEFVENGFLSKKVYEKEKKKILLKHINGFYFDHKKGYAFSKTGYFKYLFADYKFNLYFYYNYLKNMLAEADMSFLYSKKILDDKKIYKVLGMVIYAKKLPKAPKPISSWEQFNQHNYTVSLNGFDIKKVKVGRYTYGGLRVETYGIGDEKLLIGDFCSIGPEVAFILSSEHPYKSVSTYPFKVKFLNQEKEAASKGDIIIKDDVWIGMRSIILSGVTIGQGAIIAAGSVVTKSVEPYSIVGGNPAKFIKYRFNQNIRTQMLNLDFSKLTEQKIKTLADRLYTEVTDLNVGEILNEILRSI